MHPEQRLTFITLGVADLAAARYFYEEIFGWQASPTSNEDIRFYPLPGGLHLSIYSHEALADDAQVPAARSGFRGVSLAYNTRSEQEVDDLMTNLAARGVRIVKKAQKVFWGGYSGYIADPDGHLWEIAFNPHLIPA
ncbi:MAG: VOC family protein [Lewinellaceae bacterium]|nr:VOC family protein [Lewinellaceae bacterium]